MERTNGYCPNVFLQQTVRGCLNGQQSDNMMTRVSNGVLVCCRECRIQDVDANGTPIEELSKSAQAANVVSLLIKVANKVIQQFQTCQLQF